MCFVLDNLVTMCCDTLQLARRYNLSAYDAAYLELTLREGLASHSG